MKKTKRLFVDNGQPHGTVVLNWNGRSEREFRYFADAFRALAHDAVVKLRRNQRFGSDGIPIEDFHAYPVVFLYRHTLELYMKAVLLVGSPMLSVRGQPQIDREQLLKTHSLDQLRQDLERVFDAYGWDWDLGTPHFRTVDDLRRIIGEFQAIDAGSYAFRYPVDTKGLPALATNFTFNVFEFCNILDELFPTLEGAAIGAYEERQATLQAIGEGQQYDPDVPYEHDYYADEQHEGADRHEE